MTLSTLATLIDSLNPSVSISRRPESYVDAERRWSCTIHLHKSGTELKVGAEAPTLDVAMAQAFAKLEPLVNTQAVANALAIPRLAAPTIEGEVLGAE
jgi:hypothetical protein